VALVPPIPVEDIIEKHLKLRIEFDDMHARHNIPRIGRGKTDILGAIYGDGSIFIDESLDPDENPSKEGRYRFTLGEFQREVQHRWRIRYPSVAKQKTVLPCQNTLISPPLKGIGSPL